MIENEVFKKEKVGVWYSAHVLKLRQSRGPPVSVGQQILAGL